MSQRSRAEAENKAEAESAGEKSSVRGKYWRPDLNRSEWNLLNRRLTEEIESSGQYLDESTKWLYADEKGVQVFALYGIGDGTDATPLYAYGGKEAAAYNAAMAEYIERSGKYDRDGRSVDSWIELLRRKKRSRGGNLSQTQGATADAGEIHGLHGGSSGGNIRGSSERSSEDQRGVKEKFSLRDSAGRELTAAQQDYFRDSQVRDADGNLKVVYHGSAAIFTKFSADFMSQNGSSEGQGFYFTDYKPMAQGYEKNGGQLLEGYLDIKKPLSDSEVTLSAAEVKRLIRALDPTGDDLVLNYDSRGGMGYPSRTWYNRSVEDTLRATMSTSDSDSEILAELANGMGDPGKVLKTTRELLGYDGYIVEGKYDDATVYVAFDSSQFKNITNQNPTEDPDIRYSARDYGLTEDEEHAIVSYKSGDSYALNGKLATGGKLTELQRSLRDHLDTALEKLPVYKGTVYRHYDFDSFGGYEAMAEFLSQFVKGEKTNLGGYLSASTVPNESRTNGEYTVDMVIQSETGRSLNGFGRNTENEVLLPRTTELIADSMELISPHKIRMMAREVINDENGATADPTLSGVRGMRESAPGRENLRSVSGRDSGAVQEEMGRTAGRDRDAGLSGLREGTRPGSLGEPGVESDYRAAEEGLKYQPRE